jgi:acetyltransferase-like isoleucine patch superfamily enzyme
MRLSSLINRLTNALYARWGLRHCTAVGEAPSCRALPYIENYGTLIIGNRIIICSHLGPTQLSVGEGASLSIGDGVFINSGTGISAQTKITIGSNVRIGGLVSILDSDFHGLEQRDCPPPPEPVHIEDDVWIATKATILKGVTIGQGAVVAANAVVTRDVEPYTLVGGVPARLIRRLNRPSSSSSSPQFSQYS